METVVAEYKKIDPKPIRLITVRIIVGKLHQIIPETLTMAYEVLTKDTIAEHSSLEIQFIDVECKCNNCSWEGTINFPLFICSQCNSVDIEIIHGKELYLGNLEVEYNEKTYY